jgi:endo-1,4-beta-D-glucanase Y
MFMHFNRTIRTCKKALAIGLAAVMLLSLSQVSTSFVETASAAGEAKPFPQQVSYAGIIKPNHVTQSSMNASVSSYYDYWKGKYLKNNLASLPGGYYVKGEITGSAGGFTPLGTSEGQGYGMVITALMAGHDANAQTIYNGLFKTARAFKSSINSGLMGWVVADHVNAQGNFSSATDGDLDIAYSLILAHNQWGSSGTINYLSEATAMINAIKQSNVTNSNRLNLGDWDSKSALNSRPSDWMLSHLRAFYDVTGDQTWINVINSLYTAYSQVSNSYAATTGLISDFIVDNPAKPAPEWYLDEFKETNQYFYNASRVPLRIVMDYALYGDTRGKTIADKMAVWIKGKTNGSPSSIVAGYTLSGNAINSYSSAVFTSPLISAATTSTSHQAWVNAGWDWMKNAKAGYFEDTFNLLNMLYISGNWWKPGSSGPVLPGATLQVIEDSFVRGGTYGSDNYGSQTTLTIKKRDSDASYAREAYLKFNKSSVTGTINSAKIKLYVNSLHSNSTSVPIRAFGINNQAWTESTLKYSNRPTEAGTSQGSDTASAAGSYIYLDVTSFVKNFSGSVISFRIVGLTEDVGAELASKENTTASRRPVLQINGG